MMLHTTNRYEITYYLHNQTLKDSKESAGLSEWLARASWWFWLHYGQNEESKHSFQLHENTKEATRGFSYWLAQI